MYGICLFSYLDATQLPEIWYEQEHIGGNRGNIYRTIVNPPITIRYCADKFWGSKCVCKEPVVEHVHGATDSQYSHANPIMNWVVV